MKQKFILTGAFLAGLGVVLGAMASHALKAHLDEASMNSFRTGIRFQMYHAIALIALGPSLDMLVAGLQKWIYRSMLWGTTFFSFSIYGLCLLPMMGLQAKWLGPVTPIGGSMLIAAWVLTALAAIRSSEN